MTLQLLQLWSTKAWCTWKELESLCGSLHHVCKVVPPGHSFLHRMLNLLCGFQDPNHPIHLNLDFKRDLAWWLEFFGEWNGVSFFRMSSVHVALDSSGSCGFGAVFTVVPGFMVVGRSTSARLRLLSPNCSPSWSQPIFGDFNGYASKSNSCVIIRQSWPS